MVPFEKGARTHGNRCTLLVKMANGLTWLANSTHPYMKHPVES